MSLRVDLGLFFLGMAIFTLLANPTKCATIRETFGNLVAGWVLTDPGHIHSSSK